jgi:hypothetical protein
VTVLVYMQSKPSVVLNVKKINIHSHFFLKSTTGGFSLNYQGSYLAAKAGSRPTLTDYDLYVYSTFITSGACYSGPLTW